MKTSNSINRKKRVAVIVTVVALLAATLGSTYAFQDYRQHKSNELNGLAGKYEARLVEDFIEVDDWKVEDGEITKKISVTNLGQSVEGYGNVYVRLQLKEYMEIGKVTTIETERRYMIDTEGRFIYYATLAQVLLAVSATGPYPGHAYAQLTDAVTGTTGYFIETQDGDPNGQMGKHMVIGLTVGDAEKVIASGPDRASSTNHHGSVQTVGGVTSFVTRSEECDYAIHSFMPGADLETREYIDWQLGSEVITLSEWLNPTGPYNGMPVEKWIIDNSAANGAQGWVYWGQALEPDGSVTALLLESVSLIKQPDGSFYYVVHTDMEAVSLEEILNGNVDWGDVGDRFMVNAPSISFGTTPTTVRERETVNPPTVTVGPAGSSQGPLTWSSSNPDIATVNPTTGVVTGVRTGGPITISVRAPNGARGHYSITVTPGDPVEIPIENLVLNGENRSIPVGGTYTVGCTVTPTNATVTPTWSSSAAGVASVSPTTGRTNIVITGLSPGVTTITVTAGTLSRNIQITVTADTALPVKPPNDGTGYMPRWAEDPLDGDGWFGIYTYMASDVGDLIHLFQPASIHLEDIIADGNYSGVTVAATNSKYRDFVKIDLDDCGEPSIILEYVPTKQELIALLAALSGPNDDFYIPIEVTLTRIDKTATVTLHMYFWESLMMYD